MKTIYWNEKKPVEVAYLLVRKAPARCDYFGIEMRARYATTRGRDVFSQYKADLSALALSFWTNLPASQRARFACDGCKAQGCKLWREYQTFSNRTELFCASCGMKNQKKEGVVDAKGKLHLANGIRGDVGSVVTDQIGWLVPAVPTQDEAPSFWGYMSVPPEACLWWERLPSYPRV